MSRFCCTFSWQFRGLGSWWCSCPTARVKDVLEPCESRNRTLHAEGFTSVGRHGRLGSLNLVSSLRLPFGREPYLNARKSCPVESNTKSWNWRRSAKLALLPPPLKCISRRQEERGGRGNATRLFSSVFYKLVCNWVSLISFQALPGAEDDVLLRRRLGRGRRAREAWHGTSYSFVSFVPFSFLNLIFQNLKTWYQSLIWRWGTALS